MASVRVAAAVTGGGWLVLPSLREAELEVLESGPACRFASSRQDLTPVLACLHACLLACMLACLHACFACLRACVLAC